MSVTRRGKPPAMETFTYSHLPASSSVVHIALFAEVRNAKALRARIINAATLAGSEGDEERERLNFAFVDARPVRPLRPIARTPLR
jgi:EKC/KEOPS complex subunit CGI121/TPRKB